MRALPLLARLLLALLPLALPAAAGDGLIRAAAPSVHDGDTLALGPVRVRLHGIDAPELDQTCTHPDGTLWPCGRAARDRLAELAASRDFGCRAHERDAYGRLVGTCFADGRDVNRLMVAEGYAWAYRHFSSDYIPEEDAARVAVRGIWDGEAQAAWDFRAEGWRRAAGAPGAASGGEVAEGGRDCAIKGNITASGEKVYHLPGSTWYARTRIDESAGEAWFCTAAEAEAAGWRAAR